MAEEEREGGRGFRVQDRRRFSPTTGEPRSVDSSEQPDDTHPQGKPETSRPSEATSERATSAPPAEISFSSFILGLSTQALMYMGEIPPAPGQPPQTDLAAAQQMIDVLAMLKQKTMGNLDSSEEAILGKALFDLRVHYVDLVRKGRSTAQGKDKG